jgi:hypothetical protein
MRSFLPLFAVLLISACAIVTTRYEFIWIPPENAPQIVYKYYKNNEERVFCESAVKTQKPEPNSVYLACAQIIDNVCTIHLPESAPEYMITHELLHCSGWKHTAVIHSSGAWFN